MLSNLKILKIIFLLQNFSFSGSLLSLQRSLHRLPPCEENSLVMKLTLMTVAMLMMLTMQLMKMKMAIPVHIPNLNLIFAFQAEQDMESHLSTPRRVIREIIV